MKIQIEVEGATPEQLKRYTEIITILISKGALDGIRGGSTNIVFDGEGKFIGIKFEYWPWKRRA